MPHASRACRLARLRHAEAADRAWLAGRSVLRLLKGGNGHWRTQPRVPAGDPEGGQWTEGGGGGGAQPKPSRSPDKRRKQAHVEVQGGDRKILDDELEKIAAPIFNSLVDAGVKWVAVLDSVSEYRDKLGNPLAEDPNMPNNERPGAYDPKSNAVIVASSNKVGHGSFNKVLHETGHAYDKFPGRLGGSGSSDFLNAYKKSKNNKRFKRKDDYYTNPRTGPKEVFAESFARFYGRDPTFRTEWPELYEYWQDRDRKLDKAGR